MYSRNKQKDKNPLGGLFSKVFTTVIPMSVLSGIYATLSFTIASAV
ncbi:MAG: hypothetical protein JXK16_06940 [Thiotrichales bacterium]|nr:hypothetical protein [Thiotrichales bacterium]